uniref:1-phosphatidylinositol-3-phosphate 5-kinase n=1 Tax=Nicotiana tabacum TaxID=4097 RepID=A0A1S3XKJ6_TOBAC|nr:PREDICTED: putative 1-phosphatidylinositol-3-phosphate 5-kinase FAB1C [Nicotiana tabacum]
MGVPDNSLLDLIEKIKSWILWRTSHPTSLDSKCNMDFDSGKTCWECKLKFTDSCKKYNCQSCNGLFCGDCIHNFESSDVVVASESEGTVIDIKSCKLCSNLRTWHKGANKFSDKIYPSDFGTDKFDDYSSHTAIKNSFTTFSNHSSPVSLRHAPSRSDEDEGGDCTNQFFSPSSSHFHDNSDIDSSSVSTRHEYNNLRSVGSSPSDSPSRTRFISNRVGHSVQQDQNDDGPFDQEALDVLRRLEKGAKDLQQTADDSVEHLSVYRNQLGKQKPVDLRNGSLIWLPPPPDEDDETENNFFSYDDEDDEIGESGAMFSSGASITTVFPENEKEHVDHKEPLKAVVQGHFRALVLQLLQGEGIKSGKESSADDWVDIVTSLAWQAANFVKPDTSEGGSMDPGYYVKVKCVASGSPRESTLVKGVVCTKNIKHKRMTSHYKNARLLLLGGALEYQRVPNQLASFNTLLQQEREHLKRIVSRIEAHRPNVLLVEKSVSSHAQDHLLAKEISLVLNVKRPLLERIARCTGAVITPSIDNIATARLGYCELFHLEKVSEEHEPPNHFNKKPSKTLMFFDGCPRRLGCTLERSDEIEPSNEFYSAADSHQSILVSFSSRCVLNGNVCERSRLLRIKFYGSFDKPLGRYLQDDLFGQVSSCQSCKEPAEDHVICYTHQQGNLTINVRRLPSVKLPGECDKKIWMWHRCLKCAQIEGIPPATPRVVMSDAAWGLSFGKFLELSFSNNATANRVASCGHSLQRDCLRFYGCGSTIAFFRYSPIDILSVRLPPSTLDFSSYTEKEWLRKETAELLCKAKALYAEISSAFRRIEEKSIHEPSGKTEVHDCIMELKDLLMKEKSDYHDLLQTADAETSEQGQVAVDILELNRLRHSLVISSHVWDHRLLSVESLLQESSGSVGSEDSGSCNELTDWRNDMILKNDPLEHVYEETEIDFSNLEEYPEQEETHESPYGLVEGSMFTSCEFEKTQDTQMEGENAVNKTSLERAPSAASVLSDKIDSAWTGTDRSPKKAQILQRNGSEAAPFRQLDYPPFSRLKSPARVNSFDSALRLQDRIKKGLPPSSMQLTAIRSFHASGDYRNMIRDPVSCVQRTYSQISPSEAQKVNLLMSSSPSFISYASLVHDGARLMVGYNDLIISVYDNEPTSIISYALSSKEYKDRVTDKPNVTEMGWNTNGIRRENGAASNVWQSFGSSDMDYINYGSYGSEDASSTISSLFADSKTSPHLRISFEDESSNAGGKVKFSVTCYFAKQFDALRKNYCPDELDFIRSISRCKRWTAQGGKSNVYFAKSLDERFIIKQVQKTELESFEEFGPDYFKYLTDSVSSRSPTSLAKVLGIYQVSVKQMKGGRETKMDLIVMENLFFGRTISKVYDLKGSLRSRYNADKTGANKVLLDMNLLETLRTKPIFLGSKAKRSLERAVWNDTAFLASVDVMDYSLLVGVDEECKELVVGIIDFMRQYTWDKHLETWVKASGILGGPKNASPTIVSPKQYKKRFRKAMTSYFLTVPDQWSS